MHYYQFNIADYQSHTRHLTPIEDICYRRMLDWIYLHEKPLPSEHKEIARILILNDCLTSVEQVLNEYFTLVEQGYVNVRAMSEIELFNEKLEKASKAGKASAEARKHKIKQTLKQSQQTFNERSTDVQPNKKQETLNNNHKPLTNIKPIRANALDDGFNEFWNVYPKKVGKEAARKSWIKENPKIQTVLNTLRWQIESDAWQKQDGQFIPNPATYINQGRWADEPVMKGNAF